MPQRARAGNAPARGHRIGDMPFRVCRISRQCQPVA